MGAATATVILAILWLAWSGHYKRNRLFYAVDVSYSINGIVIPYGMELVAFVLFGIAMAFIVGSAYRQEGDDRKMFVATYHEKKAYERLLAMVNEKRLELLSQVVTETVYYSSTNSSLLCPSK